MTNVFLGLGGNLGDRRELMRSAVAEIRQVVDDVRVSSLYESAAWGVTDQPAFLNAVVRGRTSLNPLDLLDAVQSIENELGRVREQRWGPRLIDIDILLYGAEVIDEPRLQVPHPYMTQRGFVLRPLADLAAGLTLPDGSLVGELLTTVNQSDLRRVEGPDWAD
ncbi:MAG: 2-amino-4-hydroxy-6-hydroxymethyldihydropteridine diphosphokinase [Chloroflexi bacterium]|nr:2-amino-4-hydroxy-6-hydroxymethyldihydropteridine diphosphokinase [Chloroflexota bacterium]MXY86081.1 2-amino-4-hydroxy-6-hydroxymethyldihydropteridine diphosphokinase [Chloroflexota bacterium]MYA00679.1 2-amino-4-hydroxy-6-hydroxymethyldihydropteridine diphosphokinase [Chloroflexota bacterium]MYC02984.1 2-amino-4-hydroxy-6-hydroxymethyldihydropteridine diphosphokinase [Chloroflexota bacterium]MYJ92738.1 2-amino-4-hydroxy-6-hydroxymethyldihydropteridine diphosphokinase [Chloroflexota bacteri